LLPVDDKLALLLQEWKENIDEKIVSVVDGREPEILYDPIEYVLVGQGKRIRPLLLLLACHAVGGAIAACWDAAVAVELLHNFTLVHDDIMDEDDTRRGRPTVHKKWNVSVSLLAGDGILALAYSSLLKTRNQRLPQLVDIFTEGLVDVCEGQALDLAFETRGCVDLDEYLCMIGKKTARLLNMSAKMGALIGGGSDAEVRALGDFAYNLGLAFQIQDDMLDILSDEATIGKTYGSDVKQKKQTYLLIHALSHAGQAKREELLGLLSDSDINEADLRRVKTLFEEVGSVESGTSAVENHVRAAVRNLEQLQPGPGRQYLHAFLDAIHRRDA